MGETNMAESHVEGFCAYRRSQGQLYVKNTVDNVTRMARFMDRHREPGEPIVSKRLVEKWIAEGSENGTHPITKNRRAAKARLFALYLVRMGHEDCYVWPLAARSKDKTDFIPYILTEDEVRRTAEQFDSLPNKRSKHLPTRSIVFPAMFRTLYGCGLRRDEARLLLRSDVDLDNGLLLIRNAKDGKSRLIPMSDSLVGYLKGYNEWLVTFAENADRPFFPSPTGGFYSVGTLRHTFIQCFERAGVRNQAGNPPRIHDLRHTFAVHSLHRAVSEMGMKSYEFLPMLAAYLGHTHMRHAEYYLHLTLEGQDSGIMKMERMYGNIYKEANADA